MSDKEDANPGLGFAPNGKCYLVLPDGQRRELMVRNLDMRHDEESGWCGIELRGKLRNKPE